MLRARAAAVCASTLLPHLDAERVDDQAGAGQALRVVGRQLRVAGRAQQQLEVVQHGVAQPRLRS